MKSIITEEMIKTKHEEFKSFELAYCITVHCSQGDTIREPYSIYEWQRFNKKLMYVAMSRATMKSHVNFCNIDYDLYQYRATMKSHVNFCNIDYDLYHGYIHI
jgi:hypothetical protein